MLSSAKGLQRVAVANDLTLNAGGSGTEPLFHLLVTDEAGLLEDHLSSREDNKVRDAADLETSGQLRMRFSIDLENQRFAGHVKSGAGYLRGSCAAGSAPARPEVNKNGNGGVLDDVFKESGVDSQRLGNGRERYFACSAPACIS